MMLSWIGRRPFGSKSPRLECLVIIPWRVVTVKLAGATARRLLTYTDKLICFFGVFAGQLSSRATGGAGEIGNVRTVRLNEGRK